MTRYTLDTSDTHKYGEILLVGENREDYITVGPKGGDEEAPNYELAKKIAVVHEMYEALASFAKYEILWDDNDDVGAMLAYAAGKADYERDLRMSED